jgi:phospholipid transport system substrate-binding protein
MRFRLAAPVAAARVAAAAIALGLAFAASPLPPVARVQAQPAARDPQAEQFVQSEAQTALGILGDRDRSLAEKSEAFRGFVDRVADVPRITNFVLGKYARVITPEQRARFTPLFRQYASGVYEKRLNEYRGETFHVTGSIVRRPGDVIVASVVSGGHLDQPVPVSWRVFGEGGGWKVVDVQVNGVWLAITEQQDFVATIDNAHGDIDVLIGQLQRQVASDQVTISRLK